MTLKYLEDCHIKEGLNLPFVVLSARTRALSGRERDLDSL